MSKTAKKYWQRYEDSGAVAEILKFGPVWTYGKSGQTQQQAKVKDAGFIEYKVWQLTNSLFESPSGWVWGNY